MNLTFAQLMPLASVLVVVLSSVLVMLSIAIKRNHALSGFITLFGLSAALLLQCIPFLFKFAAVNDSWFFGLNAREMVPHLSPFISTWFSTLEVTKLFIFDGFAQYYAVIILVSSLVCYMLSYAYIDTYKNNREELYILLLIAVAGSILLVASQHMASFFISLELLSVSSVGLLAYTHERAKALESAIKYLVISATASATILMGMAFLYAYTGSLLFIDIGHALLASLHHPLAVIGVSMIVIGVAAKLSMVPFHAWTPDVYQGAPSPVTMFLASASKVAAFAVLIRFLLVCAPLAMNGLRDVLATMAILSVIIGNLLAVSQVNLKRLLAYSSIAHMGYVMIAVLCLGIYSQESIAIYIATYMLTTLAAFGAIALMSSPYNGHEVEYMADYRGLFWRRPVLASALTVLLLSMAGVPLTAGFIGKFHVVKAIVMAGNWWFAGVIVLGSVIGLYYYLRVLILLFMTPPKELRFKEQVHWTVEAGGIMVLVMSLFVLIFGVYPEPVIKYASTALIAVSGGQ